MLKKTVLVSGVAGFIGSKVASELLNRDFKVIGIDDLSTGTLQNLPDGVDFIEGDVLEISNHLSPRHRLEAILHLAGQSSGEKSFYNPPDDALKNYVTTLKLIEYADTGEVNKFLHASSMSVYGQQFPAQARKLVEDLQPNPTSIYGISKMSSELALFHRARLPSISFRMFNVYGPGQDLERRDQGMVSIFLAQFLESQHFEVKGSLDRCRDFVFIDDVVDYWCRAVEHDFTGHINLNLCSGICTSVEQLLIAIGDSSEEFEIDIRDGTPGDQPCACGDNSRLQAMLGPKVWTTLTQGLNIFRQWAQSEAQENV